MQTGLDTIENAIKIIQEFEYVMKNYNLDNIYDILGKFKFYNVNPIFYTQKENMNTNNESSVIFAEINLSMCNLEDP